MVQFRRNKHFSWIFLSGTQEICTRGRFRVGVIDIEMVIKAQVINKSALSELCILKVEEGNTVYFKFDRT